MTRWFNDLFRRSWFPLGLQLLTLTAFVLLVVGGFAANTSDMAFAKVLRNTNLANLIVWSYWWPLLILSAIFLGRVWCMICPMELVTTLAARIGLKRKPPAWLQGGWGVTVFYLLILFVGIHILAVHRVPLRMALYLLLLLSVAVVSGLLFSRNTFCAHICPVNHLLGLYARLAPRGWRVRDPKICATCKDQSCISPKTAYEFPGRSCGVGLKPAQLDDNTRCLLCGQCLKACDRHNPGDAGRPNPGWFSRRWFQDLLNLKPLTAAQVAFCWVVSGFLMYELLTEWSATEDLLLWVPRHLEAALGISGAWGHGGVKVLTLFLTLPALFWLLPFGLFRLAGGRLALSDYLLRFGIAFIPIMAAGHALKAVLKTTSRLPYWEHVFADPRGVDTARGIVNHTLTLSALPAWRDPLITLLGFCFMGVGIALSVKVLRKLTAQHLPAAGGTAAPLYLIPILYGGVFGVWLLAWRMF
jgi:hypothetical protein